MKNLNIGHITGVTVNSGEAMVKKVKEDVPAAKNATKGKMKGWKDSVKAEYKKARKGEVADPRMQEPIYARAIELTGGN